MTTLAECCPDPDPETVRKLLALLQGADEEDVA